jgi:hypothetical protein
MSLAEPATIRSVSLVECQADKFASGGEAIVVLNARSPRKLGTA